MESEKLVMQKPLWKRVVGGFFYGLFCLVVLTAGTGWGWISKSEVLKIALIDAGRGWLHLKKADPFEGKDSMTLLVLGCDEDRYFGGEQITRHQARSDMMLLCKFDFKNKKITGVSIPRDTLVSADGHRSQKINGYHVMHGNDITENNAESQRAVEALLPGVQIDRVVALNFDAFKAMVDTVGGVDIDVPKNMNYDDNAGDLHIHLREGMQHLNGDQSEGFVRFRHADDDFHRASRQHDFVLAFKRAAYKDFTKLPTVTNLAMDLTNKALSAPELASLGDFVKSVGESNIQMGLLPVVDANDEHFDLLLDRRRASDVLKEFNFGDNISFPEANTGRHRRRHHRLA
jgi:LCP family protein required for cell wall assembly